MLSVERPAGGGVACAAAAQWLETSDARAQDGTIDYVGCLLVHDPNRGSRGASHTVANHLYEVRPGRELAVID